MQRETLFVNHKSCGFGESIIYIVDIFHVAVWLSEAEIVGRDIYIRNEMLAACS